MVFFTPGIPGLPGTCVVRTRAVSATSTRSTSGTAMIARRTSSSILPRSGQAGVVSSTAILTTRPCVGSENSVLKFWSVKLWTVWLVNGSTRQKAEMNSTTSAAM